MNFSWKSSPPSNKNYTLLETFECNTHQFDAILYSYKDNCYFYLIYRGSIYFDINVNYRITINEKCIEGVHQFSKFSNDFGFMMEKSLLFNIEFFMNVINQYNSKEETSFCGLRNLGATCYINSLIQSLFHIKRFRNDIYRCNPNGKILFLQRLFFNMQNQEYVDPTEFVVNLVDDVTLHQDIHEFSKVLFDVIEKESKKGGFIDNKDIKKEIVEDLIQGHVVNFINADCGCTREIKESFQDIQVEIRDFCNNKLASNLIDSLKLFTAVETLNGENKYKCDTHGLVNAKKGVLFSDLPPVLFVLLKRFSIDFETGESSKINDFFKYPEILDLKDFCVNNFSTTYKLYSVIVHKGGHDEGHFYSYIFLNNQWYKFNDNVVTKVPKEEAMDMNFGGKHSLFRKKKDFSAYYLIYIKDLYILDEEITINSLVLDEINKQNIKKEIRCITFNNIKNYRGPGFYNLDSYNYPLTGYQEYRIKGSDTVKILKNKIGGRERLYLFKVANDKLIYLSDDQLLDGKDFFIYKKNDYIDFKKQKLVFIKIFKDDIWFKDTIPENLYLSFIAIVNNNIHKKIEDNVRISDFVLYKEDFLYKKVHKFNINDDIEHGDIFIVVKNTHTTSFECFYKDFSSRMCVNVLIDSQNCISLFLPSNLESKFLLKKIRSFFCNEEISLCPFDPVVLEYLPLEKNMVSIDIKDNKLIYLGYGEVTDYNNINCIHPFIAPKNITGKDFYKIFLSSDYSMEMDIKNLRVVDTVKDTLYLRDYSLDESFTSEGMNLFQSFNSNFIKVAYFIGNYEIKGYPFFLFVNNHTVQDFRNEYKIFSRLVKYDFNGYVDLDDTDILNECSKETFILIERN